MTLQQAKDQIAKRHGFDNFQECEFFGLEVRGTDLLKYSDEAAELYSSRQNSTLIEENKKITDRYDQLNTDYQDLVRIATALYKADREAFQEMINEGLGGDNFEKFKNHLGV